MSYRKFRLNLTAVGFPLLSELSGRTIVIPLLDENDQTSINSGLVQANPEKRNAAMYYCENVMPTPQGLQSIAYDVKIAAVGGGVTFSQILEVRDVLRNLTYIGVSTTGTLYIKSITTNNWVVMTTPSWVNSLSPSVAVLMTSSGAQSLICLPGSGIYTVDCVANTLTLVTLSGSITMSAIKGICAASNYLILNSDNYIYWSSAFDPLDFNLANSLITGTGYGVPTGIVGTIVGTLSGNSGFIVVATGNAISASLNSGNVLYPWTFSVIPNSSGSINNRELTPAPDGSMYQWSSSGLVKLTPQGTIMEYPEVTDFLVGKKLEVYDQTTDILTTTVLSSDMLVLIKMLGHRYLVISYGSNTAYFDYAIVLDTSLGRWGKLKIQHVDIVDFNISTQIAVLGATWNGVGLLTWNANPAVNTWGSLVSNVTVAGKPKRTLGFLQYDGTVQVLNFDTSNHTSTAVALIGKLSLDRQNMAKLMEVELDNIDSDATFSLQIGPSYNGKDITYPLITPYLFSKTAKSRDFTCLVTAESHTLFLKGSFNLNSTIVTMMDNGSF